MQGHLVCNLRIVCTGMVQDGALGHLPGMAAKRAAVPAFVSSILAFLSQRHPETVCGKSCRLVGEYIGYTRLSPPGQKLKTSGIDKCRGNFGNSGSPHGTLQLMNSAIAQVGGKGLQKGFLL